jgi:hypothetical protein
METYLEALDLWEAVEEDYEIPALPNNPTIFKGKGVLVCCSSIHHFHSNHVSENSKGDMGVSQD